MRFALYVSAGIAGGILAGMGMGGGTLTMPILVLLLGVGQLTAQYANLLAFLPSGTSALLLHFKNGLIRLKAIPWLLAPAIIACAVSSVFAPALDGDVLKRAYGAFLIAVALAALTAKILRKR